MGLLRESENYAVYRDTLGGICNIERKADEMLTDWFTGTEGEVEIGVLIAMPSDAEFDEECAQYDFS